MFVEAQKTLQAGCELEVMPTPILLAMQIVWSRVVKPDVSGRRLEEHILLPLGKVISVDSSSCSCPGRGSFLIQLRFSS